MSLPDTEGTGSQAFDLLLQRRCSSEFNPFRKRRAGEGWSYPFCRVERT